MCENDQIRWLSSGSNLHLAILSHWGDARVVHLHGCVLLSVGLWSGRFWHLSLLSMYTSIICWPIIMTFSRNSVKIMNCKRTRRQTAVLVFLFRISFTFRHKVAFPCDKHWFIPEFIKQLASVLTGALLLNYIRGNLKYIWFYVRLVTVTTSSTPRYYSSSMHKKCTIKVTELRTYLQHNIFPIHEKALFDQVEITACRNDTGLVCSSHNTMKHAVVLSKLKIFTSKLSFFSSLAY